MPHILQKKDVTSVVVGRFIKSDELLRFLFLWPQKQPAAVTCETFKTCLWCLIRQWWDLWLSCIGHASGSLLLLCLYACTLKKKKKKAKHPWEIERFLIFRLNIYLTLVVWCKVFQILVSPRLYGEGTETESSLCVYVKIAGSHHHRLFGFVPGDHKPFFLWDMHKLYMYVLYVLYVWI